ncbi:MAG: cytochrome c3 family protein [Chloroflexi bacterium]|nr:cytochrome c3 family protein [Chloroflexota bacterium]
MNNNRLGCLSPTAILATLLTLVAIAGVVMFTGSGFFSSGSLNAQVGENIGGVNSHAAIGNDCSRCHPAPWEAATMDERCKSCHVNITTQLANPTSLHGVMMKKNSLTCRSCHSDHHGPQESLTNMTSGTFPHNATGFSLVSHSKRSDGLVFTCSDCHGEDITRFDAAVCSTCHSKIDGAFLAAHNLAYGTDCLGCHDGIETIGKNFDHSQAALKLEGKHQGLSCEKCHLDAQSKADFKSVSADCSTCHLKDDTHKGSFGTGCAVCHKAAGWKPSSFDHNLSAFKLDGEHVKAECVACHVGNVYKGTPTACFSCHEKDDEHKGKFGQECGACHKTETWDSASFDHNLSIFKLTGAHISVTCEKCHKNNTFKGTPADCAGCHADPAFHAGMFRGQACSDCHSTINWSPAKFNQAHPEPQNVEEGGSGINHGDATCRDCHTVNLNTSTCTKCHDNNNPGGGD